MRLLYFLLAIPFVFTSLCAQPGNPIYFHKGGVEGVIFNVNYVHGFKKYASESISIDVNEVLRVDSLAYIYILEMAPKNPHLIGGWEGCPRIPDSWNDYYRQVVSYRDIKTNDEIIYIHYVHKDEEKDFPNWSTKWVSISGGCSNFVTVIYNNTKKEIVQWGIN